MADERKVYTDVDEMFRDALAGCDSCNHNCEQGRACDCCANVEDEEEDCDDECTQRAKTAGVLLLSVALTALVLALLGIAFGRH